MRPSLLLLTVATAVFLLFLCPSDGSDADGTYYQYDGETRTLTITSNVPDFENSNDAPWSGYAAEIHTIIIGGGVGRIGDRAFSGCSKVADVIVYGSPEAGKGVFEGTGSLMDGFGLVYSGEAISAGMFSPSFGGSVEIYRMDISAVSSIGDAAFKDAHVAKVEISRETEHIGQDAFSGCSVKDLIIRGDPEIGKNAFAGCTSLETADIGYLTSIPDSMFTGCTSLADVSLSRNLVSIGSSAFESSGMVSVVFPGTLNSVGDRAFASCISLVSVSFTGDLDRMGSSAFADCVSMRKTEIQSVAEPGSDAFIGCDAMERVFMKDVGDFSFREGTRIYHDIQSSADVLIRYDFGKAGGECVLFSDTPMRSSYIPGSDGRSFIGWESPDGNIVTDVSSLTESQTLTAVWSQAEGDDGTFALEVALCAASVICAVAACTVCLRRA